MLYMEKWAPQVGLQRLFTHLDWWFAGLVQFLEVKGLMSHGYLSGWDLCSIMKGKPTSLLDQLSFSPKHGSSLIISMIWTFKAILSLFITSMHKQKCKRGSGGLMCYIRNEIKGGIEYVNSTCNNLSEDRLWIKLITTYLVFTKIYTCA